MRIFKFYLQEIHNYFGHMDYNKTVLKRWSRTILSICSTLLNVPSAKRKKPNPFRVRLLLCALPLYFSAAVRTIPLSVSTAAKPLAFLCFLPDAVFRRAVLLVVSMALFPDG